MFIQNFEIGRGKAFIIAEIAQSHDGDIKVVHDYIDSIKDTGADAIKFQTHIAAAESTLDEPFRVSISGGDKTRFDYWKRMEFSFEEWKEIRDHCHKVDLIFLSSAFSVEAVELLDKLDMPAWKVGSGEYASFDLLEAMVKTGKPILLSSGMSFYKEITRAVEFIRERGGEVALFQCTSMYPTGIDYTGLNVIDELKKKYNCPVGLSDHSSTMFPSLGALARGADLVEIHVINDVNSTMPDAKSSLTHKNLRLLVEARDAYSQILNNPIDKDAVAEELSEMRAMFSKSLAFRKDQPAGTIITEEMLTMKKPGTGLPAMEKEGLIGRILKKDVDANRLLRLEDIDDE